jgi:hypothetical protein
MSEQLQWEQQSKDKRKLLLKCGPVMKQWGNEYILQPFSVTLKNVMEQE